MPKSNIAVLKIKLMNNDGYGPVEQHEDTEIQKSSTTGRKADGRISEYE